MSVAYFLCHVVNSKKRLPCEHFLKYPFFPHLTNTMYSGKYGRKFTNILNDFPHFPLKQYYTKKVKGYLAFKRKDIFFGLIIIKMLIYPQPLDFYESHIKICIVKDFAILWYRLMVYNKVRITSMLRCFLGIFKTTSLFYLEGTLV